MHSDIVQLQLIGVKEQEKSFESTPNMSSIQEIRRLPTAKLQPGEFLVEGRIIKRAKTSLICNFSNKNR